MNINYKTVNEEEIVSSHDLVQKYLHYIIYLLKVKNIDYEIKRENTLDGYRIKILIKSNYTIFTYAIDHDNCIDQILYKDYNKEDDVVFYYEDFKDWYFEIFDTIDLINDKNIVS